MTKIVLALGSNLGDREAILRAAVRDVAALRHVSITGASGLVETAALKPHGIDTDAPAYLNAVIIGETTLAPADLLHALNAIEAQHGRVRDTRWGDRTLDIDIIDYGGSSIQTEELAVPHPRAAGRAFVLAPWLQVDPEASIRGLGRVADLLEATGETVDEYQAGPLLLSDAERP